jgi:hypothetical protein
VDSASLVMGSGCWGNWDDSGGGFGYDDDIVVFSIWYISHNVCYCSQVKFIMLSISDLFTSTVR